MRVAVIASHPVQYYSPLFRVLARVSDLTVLYAHRATAAEQAQAGFGVEFDWDTDLLSGYEHVFLENAAAKPNLNAFSGVDTPDIGNRLRKSNFDVVLLMGWYLKCFLQALIAAKRLRIPAMVRGDSHLDTKRSTVKRLLKTVAYPPFLRLFDAALYVGVRNKLYWEHYHYPAQRLFFSPHCIDTQWFATKAAEAGARLRQKLGIGPTAIVVLFAGKLVPFKRPLDLIAAARLARQEGLDVEILIAGAGELEEHMRCEAKLNNVAAHFLGFQNQSSMPEVYAASNMLVLPSTARETWGLVANEALACGRPIIVSNSVGCAPDLASDRLCGRTFQEGNIRSLAQAITDVIAQPPSKSAIRQRSEEYSIDAAATGIVKAATCALGPARGKFVPA